MVGAAVPNTGAAVPYGPVGGGNILDAYRLGDIGTLWSCRVPGAIFALCRRNVRAFVRATVRACVHIRACASFA
jgi:hypothetical protein